MRYSLRTTSNYRRMLAIYAAFLAGSFAGPALGQTNVRPTLSAEQCIPLTESNYELCCTALNRTSILTPQQLGQCPPLSTSLIERAVDKERGDGGGGDGGDGGDDGDGGDGGDGNGNDGNGGGNGGGGNGNGGGGGNGNGGGGNGGGGNGGGGNGNGNGGGGNGGGNGNVNSGPGNGGEGAAGEHGDRDPGKSGEHNNAPDTPGGK